MPANRQNQRSRRPNTQDINDRTAYQWNRKKHERFGLPKNAIEYRFVGEPRNREGNLCSWDAAVGSFSLAADPNRVFPSWKEAYDAYIDLYGPTRVRDDLPVDMEAQDLVDIMQSHYGAERGWLSRAAEALRVNIGQLSLVARSRSVVPAWLAIRAWDFAEQNGLV